MSRASLKRLSRRTSRSTMPRRNQCRPGIHCRRLLCEPLEDRRLLSSDMSPSQPQESCLILSRLDEIPPRDIGESDLLSSADATSRDSVFVPIGHQDSTSVLGLANAPDEGRLALAPQQGTIVASTETPTIEITDAPPYGVAGFLNGVVGGVDFGTHRVAAYIHVEGGGWWTKPTFASPTVPI